MAQTTEQKFAEKFNYFSRYKNDKRFGRAWWYAFARAALLFFTILGYLIEAVNVANHYAEFVAVVSFLRALFAPVPIYLVSIVFFSAVVGIIAFQRFAKEFKKCIDSYKVTQKDFLCSLKNRINMEFAFATANRALPTNYKQLIHTTKLKLPEFGLLKKLELLVHGVIAAVGWLQAWSEFTGLAVFSITPIFGAVVPPVVFSVLFILLVALVTAYIEGVINVEQKYHRAQAVRIQEQFTYQFELVLTSLQEDNPADRTLKNTILQNSCESTLEFSENEMLYAMEHIDIANENMAHAASPASVRVAPIVLSPGYSTSPPPRIPAQLVAAVTAASSSRVLPLAATNPRGGAARLGV